MTSSQFARTYLQYEANIKKVLNSKKIFDEDLLHDTYIALYEHTPHPQPCEFVNTFVEFYKNRFNWQKKQENAIDAYDNAHLAALEIFDESVGEEALDDRIDNDRITYREQALEQLPQLLKHYYKHPQPGERNHERACKIVQMYLDGCSFREIARQMKLDVATVHKYFNRTVGHLKANAPVTVG